MGLIANNNLVLAENFVSPFIEHLKVFAQENEKSIDGLSPLELQQWADNLAKLNVKVPVSWHAPLIRTYNRHQLQMSLENLVLTYVSLSKLGVPLKPKFQKTIFDRLRKYHLRGPKFDIFLFTKMAQAAILEQTSFKHYQQLHDELANLGIDISENYHLRVFYLKAIYIKKYLLPQPNLVFTHWPENKPNWTFRRAKGQLLLSKMIHSEFNFTKVIEKKKILAPFPHVNFYIKHEGREIILSFQGLAHNNYFLQKNSEGKYIVKLRSYGDSDRLKREIYESSGFVYIEIPYHLVDHESRQAKRFLIDSLKNLSIEAPLKN